MSTSEFDPRSWFDNLPADEQEAIVTQAQVVESDEAIPTVPDKSDSVWDGVWPAR